MDIQSGSTHKVPKRLYTIVVIIVYDGFKIIPIENIDRCPEQKNEGSYSNCGANHNNGTAP